MPKAYGRPVMQRSLFPLCLLYARVENAAARSWTGLAGTVEGIGSADARILSSFGIFRM